MTDKILKEAFDKMVALEEATSPEEKQINVLTLRMRQATKDDDEAAYKRAVDALNALTDKMNAEQPIEEAGVSVQQGEHLMDGMEEFTMIQDQLLEITEQLEQAIREFLPRKLAYWQSYGLAHLKVVAGSDEYATSDESVSSLIKELQDEAQGADDDYDDDEGRGPRGRRR